MVKMKHRLASPLRGAGLLLIPCALMWLAGCTGGGSTSSISGSDFPALANPGGVPTIPPVVNPAGNAACLQCHFSFPSDYYNNGDPFDVRYTEPAPGIGSGVGIGPNYQKGIHNSDMVAGAPMCETCHGDGGQHFGIGPIPRWAPSVQQCGACHTGPAGEWAGTAHANPDQNPDAYFGQGGGGAAQAQAADGSALFQADGTTPVSKDQRIEECSSCHAYAQGGRPKHIASGDVLNPPNTACGSCHDSHSPALHNKIIIPTRPNGIPGSLVLRLKPVRVNNNPALPQFGAMNSKDGVWVRPGLAYPWHPTSITDAAAGFTSDAGYVTTAGVATGQGVQADNLRLSSERLCAACHTRGNYKYTAFKGATPDPTTHNADIFSQFRQAGHSMPTGNGYSSWSLLTSLTGSRRPQYPMDLGKLPFPFPPAYPTAQPAPPVPPVQDFRLNGGSGGNNTPGAYTCYQCHNGIGSIDYLKGSFGDLDIKNDGSYAVGAGDSKGSHIMYGDCTTTCITCHDPHENQGTAGLNQKNVRIPVHLSYNLLFNDLNNPGHGNRRGSMDTMMDGTAIPDAAKNQPSLICLFCHQGRDSSYFLYRKFKALGLDYFNPPTPNTYTGTTTPGDEHHLAGGGLLWSKNSYEFRIGGVAQTYSNGIPAHQAKNCTGCHMSPVTDTVVTAATKGGHTFHPDIKTCQECHVGITDFLQVNCPVDIDGDPSTMTVFSSIGDYSVINWTVAPQATDKGLFNILRYAFYENGYELDGTSLYIRKDPYNKTLNHVTANRVTVWTPEMQQAIFNFGSLQNVNIGNALYVHNYYYASQILIDCIRALGRNSNPATGLTFQRPTTPIAQQAGGTSWPAGTTHPATDYSQIVIP